MGPIGVRLRAEFRGRWRGWLGLVLLIGVFGGATLATNAASRRTNSAYPRFLEATNPFDQFFLTGDLGESFANVSADKIGSIPQVREVIRSNFISTTESSVTPSADVIASEDPRLDRTFNRAKAVDGHIADPNAPDQAMVPVAIAKRIGAKVGKRITIDFLPAEGTDVGLESTTSTGKPIPMTFRVVAIIAEAGEFPPESDLGPPRIHLTPAFARANQKRFAFGPYILVWFHHGTADLPAFRKELVKRFDNKPVIGYTQSSLSKNVERSFHLQAVSLELFAAALAVVTMLVLGQTLGRQAAAEANDYPALRALGMTPRQLTRLGFVRAGMVAIAGALLAIPVAWAFSPLAPTGLARAAEPTPGLSFDANALLLGGAVSIAVLLLFAVIPILRAARVRGEREGGAALAERVSRGAVVAARAGVSVPALVGVRLALEPGRGRTSVPVRTTIAGVALAVGAVVLSLTFGASLQHLLNTPRLYGVRWSTGVAFDDDETTTQRSGKALAAVRADPDIEAAGYSGLGIPLLINGVVQADAMMLPGGDKTFIPTFRAGRLPHGPAEIVLGPKTLQRLHLRVGDHIAVGTVGTQGVPMTIVGDAVIPPVGHTANLGEGAYMTFDAVGAFVPGATAEILPRDAFLVRYKPGVRVAKTNARLAKEVAPFGGQVRPPEEPADLLNFGRNKNLPYLLSGMLAALALATLAHAMFTAINRRRRDLAILKTLGFTRIDTGKAVAWQSTIFISIALAIGIVGGAAIGKWLWNVYANGLGVVAEPRVPALVVLAIVPIGIVIANTLALIPGRIAAATRPALVLRTE